MRLKEKIKAFYALKVLIDKKENTCELQSEINSTFLSVENSILVDVEENMEDEKRMLVMLQQFGMNIDDAHRLINEGTSENIVCNC